MDAASVIQFWTLFEEHKLEVTIDGGWAVDAVLGEQTRPHDDLDIALPAHNAGRLRALLAAHGFVEVPRPDSWEHNFVLEDPAGRLIDVHTYILAPDGTNAGGVDYVADHLDGSGTILGTRVHCVPPDWLVPAHTGYEIDENDWHDVRLLCERFGLEIPAVYAPFMQRGS